MARSTASFLNVPPCTTILLPKLEVLLIRTTFVNTFCIIERHNPAIISSVVQPFFCSVIILLFINTVQRLPRFAGRSARNAASAISFTGICKVSANFSKKEPHPDEHASLSIILVTTPSATQIAFISCPPISRIKLTSGT